MGGEGGQFSCFNPSSCDSWGEATSRGHCNGQSSGQQKGRLHLRRKSMEPGLPLTH